MRLLLFKGNNKAYYLFVAPQLRSSAPFSPCFASAGAVRFAFALGSSPPGRCLPTRRRGPGAALPRRPGGEERPLVREPAGYAAFVLSLVDIKVVALTNALARRRLGYAPRSYGRTATVAQSITSPLSSGSAATLLTEAEGKNIVKDGV